MIDGTLQHKIVAVVYFNISMFVMKMVLCDQRICKISER